MKQRGFLAAITAGTVDLVTSKDKQEKYFKSEIIDRTQEYVAPDINVLELYNNNIVSCSGVLLHCNINKSEEQK